MLEAMVCGAFPIQTNTSCADEWIVDGKSGFIVDPDNLMNLVSLIKTALIENSLVDGAEKKLFGISKENRSFYYRYYLTEFLCVCDQKIVDKKLKLFCLMKQRNGRQIQRNRISVRPRRYLIGAQNAS